MRRVIPFTAKEQQQNLTRNLHLLLALKSPHAIRITRILEQKHKHFVLDYEYLPEHFKGNTKSTDNGFLGTSKEKIMLLCG